MPHSAPAAEAVFGVDGLDGELRRAEAALGRGPAVRVSSVQPQSVEWLWFGRIPLGKLTVLDGDPGLGKSTITLDIAARVSRGLAMSDGTPGVSGGVVLAGAEDDLADTVRPRLDAAGADCERVAALPVTAWADVADTETLRRAIGQVQARLVVIDPLMAYLSAEANSWRDADVRRVLAPLAAMAAAEKAAVVLVRHLRKAADGNPLYRGGGSIGIIGAARSGLLVAKDPDDAKKRVLAVTKSNLAREAPSMGYRLAESGGAVRVEWLGESAHLAPALLGQPVSAEDRSDLADACTWLSERLSAGAAPARDVRGAMPATLA